LNPTSFKEARVKYCLFLTSRTMMLMLSLLKLKCKLVENVFDLRAYIEAYGFRVP